jgi:hypothetical protein
MSDSGSDGLGSNPGRATGRILKFWNFGIAKLWLNRLNVYYFKAKQRKMKALFRSRIGSLVIASVTGAALVTIGAYQLVNHIEGSSAFFIGGILVPIFGAAWYLVKARKAKRLTEKKPLAISL